MKLTIEIIYEELKNYFPKIQVYQTSPAFLEYAMLYEENELEESICYVTDYEIPSLNPNSLLVTTKCNISHNKYNYITINENVSLNIVFNKIIKIFQKYASWEHFLQKILNSSGSLQKMLSASVSIFGNLLASNDSSYLSVFLEGPNYSNGSFTESVSREFMEKIFKDFNWNPNSKEPISNDVEGYAKNIALNIFDKNRFLGSISVSETHQKLRSFDGYLLTILGNYMKQAILLYGYYDLKGDNSIEKTLGKLLIGKTLNENEKNCLTMHMNNYSESIYYTLVISNSYTFNDDYYHLILRNLSIRFTCMFIHEKNYPLVILVYMNPTENLSKELTDALKNQELQIGVSDHFTNLFKLHNYYLQAKLALTTAHKLENKNQIIYFSDYSLEYILTQIDNADVLYPTGLKRLMDYDKTGRVSYVDTLEIYLRNNNNALKTAKELQITRNSLLSRLERLMNILDMDVDNYSNRLYLSLCIELINHTKKA